MSLQQYSISGLYKQTHNRTLISREMSRFSADLSSSATDTKSLDQGHVYNMFLCLCVCVFYLGTAVRVTSGTCLELADPKLLLLGIRGYRKTHTEQKLIKKIKTHMLLTRLTN